MRDDHDYSAALTFLSGEMSPREEELYARRLAEDEAERARYLETAEVWLALGSPANGSDVLPSELQPLKQEPRQAAVSRRTLEAAPTSRSMVARRLWLPRWGVLALVFACGLLLGRVSLTPPGPVDAPLTDSQNTPEQSPEPLPEATRLAVAWFDMQEEQPADSIQASILADLDLAELSEGSLWEADDEWSSEQVPDWLLVALELSHARTREDSADERPLSAPTGGESL